MIKNQDINQNRKNSKNKTPDIKEHQSKNRHITETITAIPKITALLFITVITILITAGTASAYVINFEMPSTVQSGELLVISGTSTLPSGFSTGIEFYKKIQTGNKKVATVPFTILNDGLWSVYIDTTGWLPGEYTMSIQKSSEYSYGSSSTIYKAFTVTEGKITPEATAAVTDRATVPKSTAAENIPSTGTPGVTDENPENPATTQIPNQASAERTATGTPLPLWIPALALVTALFLIKTKD